MARRLALVIGQLQQGGAEGQLVHLALGLRGSAYEPVVACLSEVAEPHASTLRSGGVPVEIFSRRRHRDPGRVVALARFLRDRRAEMVHSFLVGANVYAYAASRLARVRRLVVSSRTTMRIPSTPAFMLHSWIFRNASAVVANAFAVRDFTASYYGVPASRIRVVPNGVDLSAYNGAPAGAQAVRRDLGVAADAVLIGTLGRISPEKNLELFVETAAALAREAPGLRFAVIGDGPHRRAVEESVRGAALADRLVLTGARSDVPQVLAALDIFVMTSDTEGLPNAVMEAMAAGLPVVATRVGGTPELVVEGETGRLVPPGRSAPLLEALRDLVADRAMRRRMGEAGRARIAAEFTLQRMVAGTRAVYDALFDARSRRGAWRG